MRLLPLAAILFSLALAAPAYADAGTTTVGAPQVITDPSGQVDPATTSTTTTATPPPTSTNTNTQADTGDSTPPPLHVTSQLIGQRHSSSTDASSPATTSSPASSTAAAPASDPAPAQQPSAQATSSKKQLPFTGIAAWQIAALGFALIAAGAGLWRIGETTRP